MSHLTLRHAVHLDVTTTDGDLLDALEADLPTDGADEVAEEYDGPRRVTDAADLADGEERLTARVTVQDTDATGASTHASDLFDALTAHDLPTDATVRHYRSPTGGVSADDVAAWYRDNPEEQPTDDDGVAYIPTAWDPDHHVVSEF